MVTYTWGGVREREGGWEGGELDAEDGGGVGRAKRVREGTGGSEGCLVFMCWLIGAFRFNANCSYCYYAFYFSLAFCESLI